MNRRKFLQLSTAGLAYSALSLSKDTGYAAEFADAKKRVGLIGTGWYGKCDLWRLVQVAPVEIVSLCDVDKRMLDDAAKMAATRQTSKKEPRKYTDYREMLKEKDLDLVLIGTPDHWHALPAIAAMESGMDVWVQKPVSVDVAEGQAILRSARKHNRVVQVGTQRRSTPHLVEARDRIIKEGKLGKIAHVEICCYWHMRAKGNPPDIAPPDYLDYEMWTGPAPMRPFCQWTHPRGWRAFEEYGNGIVGDMCIHMLDMVRWMLDLGWPKQVSSSGGILVDKASKANISDTQTATFDFDGLPVVWNHRTWGESVDPEYPWSATIYGEKGTLKCSVFKYEFFPVGKKEATEKGEPLYEYDKFPEDRTERDLERHCASAIRWHMQDFLKAIAERGQPVADIEQGYISTASCILANLSMRLGRSLAWDPVQGQVRSDPEANRLLKRPYRSPWVHPSAA
ncbi:MAG: Gfo/Idh/MocA family protein [Verrucomicrobiia bacterium]